MNTQKTPYFLFDKNRLKKNITNYSKRNFSFYYSTKSCLFDGLVQELAYFLDGFTVSSVHDLKKVRETIQDATIHFVSPLIRNCEIQAVNDAGNSITFNSLEQFERLSGDLSYNIKKFIRINPEISFLNDLRYDPCRKDSKLGVPLNEFILWFSRKKPKLTGIHFHNNCQSDKPEEIEKTMDRIEHLANGILPSFEAINMGGGYTYSEKFMDTINNLASRWFKRYDISLAIEPSFDITNSAGYLISSVVDIFKRKNKRIAILDTSINHIPEVFEYGDRLEIFGHNKDRARHHYLLAGASCFAGDIFGEYSFQNHLTIKQKIVFMNVGSYSHVRANKFNGIPIPSAAIGSIEESIMKRER